MAIGHAERRTGGQKDRRTGQQDNRKSGGQKNWRKVPVGQFIG